MQKTENISGQLVNQTDQIKRKIISMICKYKKIYYGTDANKQTRTDMT